MSDEERALREEIYKSVADEVAGIVSSEWGKRWIRGMSDPELGRRVLSEIVEGLRRAGEKYGGKQ